MSNESRKEYIDFVVDVRRVTKVTKGGKRFQFSAFVVSGDGNGKVGYGKGKGRDVSSAVSKATTRARKSMFLVSMRRETKTVPYDTYGKHGSCYVYIRPASQGTGLIVGGAIRLVAQAAGLNDLISKSIGPSRSKVNLVKAALNAFSKCRTAEAVSKVRGKRITEIIKGNHHVE